MMEMVFIPISIKEKIVFKDDNFAFISLNLN